MDPEEPAGRALGAGYKYVSMGIAFAGGIVMFMGLGWLLDRWLGTLPLFLIAGALAGSVLSFTWVYRRLMQEENRLAAERNAEPPSRRAAESAIRPPDSGSE